MVNQIIKALGIPPERVAPMAYTGTAAINMRAKGMMNAKTIYAWCYRCVREPVKDPATGKPVIDPVYNIPKVRLSFVPINSLPDIDIIVADEAGSIPPDMRATIDKLGIPVIAAGDLNQLPPIFGTPGYLNDPAKVHQLTEIVRQQAGNTIIQFSQMALAGQDIPLGRYGNVAVIYEDEISDNMLCKSDIVICSKNATRYNYIDHIRHELLGYDYKMPMHGERVVCRKNNWDVEAGGINLTNGLLGNVINYPDISTVDRNRNTFKLSFKPDLCNDIFHNLEADFRFLNSRDQKEKNMLKMSERAFGDKFEFGYAITTHMAQGSEFNQGIYIEEYLNRDINNKLNYVGLTRFKNKCIYAKRRPKRYW
jgi:exodeoxyribonuclease-5